MGDSQLLRMHTGTYISEGEANGSLLARTSTAGCNKQAVQYFGEKSHVASDAWRENLTTKVLSMPSSLRSK